ncbi:MAG: MBL fold metallo-hydrolase [Candidatus Methanomethylophilaceae archaeon]
MSKAEILCLYDEGAQVGTQLIGGKGFSVLIDVDGERTLFDTGRRGRYLRGNMDILGIEPDSVTRVVISHGSIGHIGGLDAFMSGRREKVEVHSHPSSWNVRRLFGGKIVSDENEPGIMYRYIGEEWVQLSKNLFLSPPLNGVSNESVLVLTTDEGAVVISACAHCGITDALEAVSKRFGRIYAIVGGLHIQKCKQKEVNEVASTIKDTYGVRKLILNGCTGAEGIQKMRVATSNDGIKDLFVGDKLEFQTY